jgi:hypothetical protein
LAMRHPRNSDHTVILGQTRTFTCNRQLDLGPNEGPNDVKSHAWTAANGRLSLLQCNGHKEVVLAG